MDLDGRLVVGGRGIDLGLAGRNRGVAVDHLGHDAAERLDAEGQRRDVEQQDAFDIAGQDAALDGRADGDDLVGVDGHVRLLAGHVLDQLLDGRHTGRTADEDDLVDFTGTEARVGQRAGDGRLAALEQIARDALEFGAGQRVVQMDRLAVDGGDERQVDIGLGGIGELHLGLLGRFLQALEGHLVGTQVDALVGLELGCQPVDDALVPVVAAQVVVARGGENLEDAVAQLEHGHIERAAAQVEDQDLLILIHLVEAVSQSRGCGLVDDALDIEAGDLAGVLRGLALRVVEVRGDGDDGFGDGAADLLLRVGLQLLEHHRGNFLGRIGLAVDVDDRTAVLAAHHLVRDGLLLLGGFGEAAADESLDRRDGVLGVGDRLVLGGLADDAFAVLAEAFDRRRGAVALGVHENSRLIAFHDGHGGVRGAKVDAQDLSHMYQSSHIRIPHSGRWRGSGPPTVSDLNKTPWLPA